MYWIMQRHGSEALHDFWVSTTQPTTAENFRTAFEEGFGESLDQMLADVEGQKACQIITCVGAPKPWSGAAWTTTSPRGCEDDRVVGIIDGDNYDLVRYDLVEIVESGIYEISVSDGATFLAECGLGCSINHEIGTTGTLAYPLTMGLYRVATIGVPPEQESYQVQIVRVE
jgi:hypothetical protein